MDDYPADSKIDFDAYLEEDEVILDDDDFMDFIGDDFCEDIEEDIEL